MNGRRATDVTAELAWHPVTPTIGWAKQQFERKLAQGRKQASNPEKTR